jgi:hypothetical protein
MTVSPPQYISVIPQIPHVRTESEQSRPLSAIQHQVGHYEGGPFIVPADWTPAQEVAHMIELAIFHQHRDFGGGVLGRTLEYTYVIFPSGRIFRANRETLQTWSHKNGNRVGMSTLFALGIGQEPTAAMLATAKQHFDYTISRTDMRVTRQRTWGHGETDHIYGGGPAWGNDTRCPEKVLPWIKQYRMEEPMPEGPSNPDQNGFFKATGHSFVVGGGIANYWQAHGGVGEFGYPLEQEQAGDSFPYSLLPELAGYTVQTFERQAIAWKPGQEAVVVRLGAVVEALMARGRFDASSGCACG